MGLAPIDSRYELMKPKSDREGAYLLVELPIGHYQVEAHARGFQKYLQQGISLDVNVFVQSLDGSPGLLRMGIRYRKAQAAERQTEHEV